MSEATLRLARAMQHLKALRAESVAFLNNGDHGVINDFDAEPGYLIVKGFSRSEPPPVLSLLIGEALYQMRAALDGLACELAEANGEVVDRYIEFPIFDERPKFDGKRQRTIGKLSAKNQEIIFEQQPFNVHPDRPTDDPLWDLYLLSNYDRHRSLHVTTATSRGHDQDVQPPAIRPYLELEPPSLGPLVGEAEVARYRLTNPAAVNVMVDSRIEMDIAFASSSPIGYRLIWHTFGDIGMRLGRLLKLFQDPTGP